MFSCRTVHYVAFLSILAGLCQMCSSISDVEDKNVSYEEKLLQDIEQNKDSPHLHVKQESENAHVEFIIERSPTVEEKREDEDHGVFLRHWIRERLRNAEKLTSVEIPLTVKRIVRQANPGYASLYPTLPTKSNYGNYGPYSYNNGTNSYPYGQLQKATNENRYNYNNFTRPSNFNFSATGQNPYYPQSNYNQLNPGANNVIFPNNRPTNNGNQTTTQFYPGGNSNLQNPSYPQPYGRPNNGSYSNIPQPYYPGTTNGMHPGYPAPSSRPYYQSVTSNYTNPYLQSTARPAYPGATSNGMKPGYAQPYGRPAYPGAINNGTNTGYFPTTSRPSYPGATNSVTPVYPQPGSRPVYPGAQNHIYPPSTGKPFYPRTNNTGGNPSYGHSSYPVNSNFTNPAFNNVYNNNNSKPYSNFPNSNYNSQTRYPPYNPNYNIGNTSSVHGHVPGNQRPSYNNSAQQNSWGGNSQGYGQNSLSPYATTPLYGSYNNHTPNPDAQYFGNTPNRPYSQNNGSYSDTTWNKPNPSPNQYNAGVDYNNFFYSSKTNGPQYDPHKNPPNQFSYHGR